MTPLNSAAPTFAANARGTRDSATALLGAIGPGRSQMMTTAYDTAWIAHLAAPTFAANVCEDVGLNALSWLRANQLPDGSWGAISPYYAHDRVICTLAASFALKQYGTDDDLERAQRGMYALRAHIPALRTDPAGETIGFELIVPNLLDEVRDLGGAEQQIDRLQRQLAPLRQAKLQRLPQGVINRNVTLAFSAELAGFEDQHLLDVGRLQEANGSVAFSPSASAYYALYVSPGDEAALEYLRGVARDGEAPNVAPFDVFEQAWVLWNLALAWPERARTVAQPPGRTPGDARTQPPGRTPGDARTQPSYALNPGPAASPLSNGWAAASPPSEAFLPALEALMRAWDPERGIGFASGYQARDADETAIVTDVLARFGRARDLSALLHYEEESHFRCFDLEANPSVSANIHVLGALHQAGLPFSHRAVQKVLRFMERMQARQGLWFDKWHASPYYATAHAVIACLEYAPTMAEAAVRWILHTQHGDGSWGYYLPTAEETAYCLQALGLWRRRHGPDWWVDLAIQLGREWLLEHTDPPYAALWIGKCLYCPTLVIRSAVISALTITDPDQG